MKLEQWDQIPSCHMLWGRSCVVGYQITPFACKRLITLNCSFHINVVRGILKQQRPPSPLIWMTISVNGAVQGTEGSVGGGGLLWCGCNLSTGQLQKDTVTDSYRLWRAWYWPIGKVSQAPRVNHPFFGGRVTQPVFALVCKIVAVFLFLLW